MRFRFSIRDLLWLTLVVAVLLAWWVDHRRIKGFRVTVYVKGMTWVTSSETGQVTPSRIVLGDCRVKAEQRANTAEHALTEALQRACATLSALNCLRCAVNPGCAAGATTQGFGVQRFQR